MIIVYFILACIILDYLTAAAKIRNQRKRQEAAQREKLAAQYEKQRQRQEAAQQKELARRKAAEQKAQDRSRKTAFNIQHKTTEYYQLMNYRRSQWLIFQDMLQKHRDAPERKKPAIYKQIAAQRKKINDIDLKMQKIKFEIDSSRAA